MTDNKDPSYPWYPRDFANDEPVQMMSLAAEGAYRRLLDHQWLHGSIPADKKQISNILKHCGSQILNRLWVSLEPLFPPVPDQPGRLQNHKLERIRAERSAYQERQSEAGRRGADARWVLSDPNAPAMATPLATPMPQNGSASASASASAKDPPLTPPTLTISTKDQDRWKALAGGMDDKGRSALEQYRRASRDPPRLLAELESLALGKGTPDSQPVPVEILGSVLHDMALAGVTLSAKRLRAFIRGATEPPRRNGHPPAEGDLSDWVRRKEAEARNAH